MHDAEARLPLSDLPALRTLAPYYFEWLAHPTPDAYWQAASLSARYEQIQAPALNIGGWYDVFLWGTLQNYMRMRQRGGSAVARQHQRLVIGPWTHGNFSGSFPEREFGAAASSDAIDLSAIHLRWFDHWLKGIDNDALDTAPVRLYQPGTNAWREVDHWPLSTREEVLYLGYDGTTGTLSAAQPAADGPAQSYRYDPQNPAPTQIDIRSYPVEHGPLDQTAVESREDVILYTSEPLAEELVISGWAHLLLHASSDCTDTEWHVKITDVDPDGRSKKVCQGCLRASYRDSLETPTPL